MTAVIYINIKKYNQKIISFLLLKCIKAVKICKDVKVYIDAAYKYSMIA